MTVFALVLAAAAAALPPQPAAPKTDPAEFARAESARFDDAYRAIVAYHVLLQGERGTKPVVEAALYDAQRLVEDMDARYATDELFVKAPATLEKMKRTLARAHLQVAFLNGRGVDLERSTAEYEKAAELLGFDPADWDVPLERTASLGTQPLANDVAFDMALPRDVVEDLKQFWSAGVIARFSIEGYTLPQRAGLALERVGAAREGFATAAFDLAAGRFAERAAAGETSFRVALPPGRYRVTGGAAAEEPFEFMLAANGVPDPIVVNPDTFAFEFAAAPPGACRPRFTLNGIAVTAFDRLRYGTYRIEPPAGCGERLPDKITVTQRPEVTVRMEPERLEYARAGQPIFLFVTTPPGSRYKLRF
jgi:hypothetical protein